MLIICAHGLVSFPHAQEGHFCRCPHGFPVVPAQSALASFNLWVYAYYEHAARIPLIRCQHPPAYILMICLVLQKWCLEDTHVEVLNNPDVSLIPGGGLGTVSSNSCDAFCATTGFLTMVGPPALSVLPHLYCTSSSSSSDLLGLILVSLHLLHCCSWHVHSPFHHACTSLHSRSTFLLILRASSINALMSGFAVGSVAVNSTMPGFSGACPFGIKSV